MVAKYKKFGLRRDRNLGDANNSIAALGNLLNDLPTIQGETFTPEDLYVINGIRNLKTSNDELKSLANIREVFLNENTNILETVRPLVTLKDRVDNFKIFTENPIFGPGGDGPLSYIIPLSNINSNITNTTSGADLFTNNENVIGPIKFWDDGGFILDNRLYPTFTNNYGMIQWVGYFSKDLLRTPTSINVKSTGLIKIEQNPTDTVNGWSFLKNIYSDNIPIVITSDGNQSDTYNIGEYIIYAAINQQLSGFENVTINSINESDQTITLSEPITLDSGANNVNLTFEIGTDEIEISFRLFDSYINDKIKTRFSVWWPNVNRPSLTKNINFNYIGGSNDTNLVFSYFYSSNDRSRLPQSTESIEYFFLNRLNNVNTFTNNDITVNNLVSFNYDPPKLLTEKILFPNKTTVTNLGVGKIQGSNVFVNAIVGDWIVIRPTNSLETRAFQIKEKINNSNVFIEYNSNLGVDIGQTFSISIVKNFGLVGIYYYITNFVFELSNLNFLRRKIENDYLCLGLSDDGLNNTNFLKIDSYNSSNGNISVSDFQSGGQSLSTGLIIIYQDKGIIDNSKKVFCQGVIGKETTNITNISTTTIDINNVSGLYTGQYVQYNGFIPENTTITNIGTNSITISNATIQSIPSGSTIVFSPDNVNREICIVPLNTAPPFEGTVTGLKTSTLSPGLWVNELEFKNLTIETATGNISTVGSNTTYTKTINVNNNNQTYKLLIV